MKDIPIWYAAHIIMLVKFKDGKQDRYPIFENIVLIKAKSEPEALSRAESRGREDESNPDSVFSWDERPAVFEFVGIRKLIECSDFENRPDDGVEVSYSNFEIENEESLHKLVQGEPVSLEYRE